MFSSHRNRFDFVNHVRKLTDDDWKDEEEEEEEEGMDVEMKMKKPGRFYKDQVHTTLITIIEINQDFFNAMSRGVEYHMPACQWHVEMASGVFC